MSLDGEYGVWDFLISPESPVSLYALTRIFITEMERGLQATEPWFIESRHYWIVHNLPSNCLTISYINMGKVFIMEVFNILTSFQDEGLQPLHIKNVKSLSFTISLTDVMDQMYRCVSVVDGHVSLPFRPEPSLKE